VWRYDLKEALEDASARRSYVMADFYTDWCGWCKKLDRETYENKEVSSLMKDLICVKIDGDRSRDLVSRYAVRGYPTIIFFGPDGKEVRRIPGFVEAPALVAILKEFAPHPAPDEISDKLSLKGYVREGMGKLAPPALKLSGIAKSPGGYRAFIGDDIVKVGDRVGKYKVKAIDAGSVTLVDSEGREVVLK
jgi:thiol-disulfide isomerase/thioredoxin